MRTAAMVLAGALVTAGAAAAAPEAAFRLAYRATPAPLEYAVRTVERRGANLPGAAPRWVHLDMTQQLAQDVSTDAEGKLTVHLTGKGVHVEGEVHPLPELARWTMSARGERVEQRGLEGLPATLAPVFPAEAIRPGTTWQSAVLVPGTQLTVNVTHAFVRVDVVQGMPCAVILSQGEVKGRQAGTSGDPCGFKGNAKLAFSLTDGAVVAGESFCALSVKTVAPDLAGPVVLHREVLRTIARLAPGK